MKNLFSISISFFGLSFLIFLGFTLIEFDVGSKHIHYTMLIKESLIMSFKIHLVILPIHFLTSKKIDKHK
ncbi:hypothetical protein BKK52_12115 [Rodentibacter trehalosifermentans]|uniref:Uncharacterized protein n=1 Tax=Rodentibacter trehalosifermentans TaxID=1908263 RepID=A0A1V3IUF5_9PAST|nr:hypothetical protein BKK52_12115 [Rodentibacter trehalosifermentans]